VARDDMTYVEAMDAMQSGVAYDQANGSQCGSPKRLRVGLNGTRADQAALAKLLIAKGVMTEGEYAEAIRQEAIAEVRRYEAHLSATYGVEVKLG
jgi:hypothetical protein